jgi:hypothetical protein
MLSMEHNEIAFTMNERSVRALHSAVVFTLEKWAGQGNLDQDCLLSIKPVLQGCVFEFDFNRSR